MPAPPGFGGPGIQFVNPDQNAMRDMILNALMETGLALPDGALRFEG